MTRRGAVKTDGYDSDSSGNGDDPLLSQRGEIHDTTEAKFLALSDIEGQEFIADTPQDGLDALDDDALEDEHSKLKESMGFQLSSFNMKAEMDEGKFAEDGTFHRTFDPHEAHDKWMEGIDDREMRKARLVKRKMEEQERVRVRHEEDIAKSRDEVTKDLVCLLDKGETVLEALQRLGKGTRSKFPDVSRHPRKARRTRAHDHPNSTSVESDEPRDSTSSSPSPIERITALSSTLMSLGNMDVYEETYESLLRFVRRSGIVPTDWTPPFHTSTDPTYEYRWSPSYLASSDAETVASDVFGPFPKDQLIAWKTGRYFGEKGEHVQLRERGQENWGGWELVS